MNKWIGEGELVKAPYVSPKGWVGATLAVQKPGTNFKEWVELFIPSGEATKAFAGAQKNERFCVEGSWETKKKRDDETAREWQVKVAKAKRVEKKWDAGTEITDEDIPF